MYSRWAGRAASGSLANAGLVPLGWSTDPLRYTTPRTTAQAGLPYLNCRLVPGCQPFSVVSLCQVNPLAVVAAEAAVLPPTMPNRAVSGIATTAAAATRERMERMGTISCAAQDPVSWSVRPSCEPIRGQDIGAITQSAVSRLPI